MDYETFQKNIQRKIDYSWQPANGGREEPFLKQGKIYLYMWNRTSGQHAYYCVSDDLFLTDLQAFSRL